MRLMKLGLVVSALCFVACGGVEAPEADLPVGQEPAAEVGQEAPGDVSQAGCYSSGPECRWRSTSTVCCPDKCGTLDVYECRECTLCTGQTQPTCTAYSTVQTVCARS